MFFDEGTALKEVTADQSVTEDKTLLYSVLVSADVDGTYCVIYDGKDAISGTRKLTLYGEANKTRQFTFDQPAQFYNGVYIDLQMTGKVTLNYKPINTH